MKGKHWRETLPLFSFLFTVMGAPPQPSADSGFINVQAELMAFPAEQVEKLERIQTAPLSTSQFIQLAQQGNGRTLEKITLRLGEAPPPARMDPFRYPMQMERGPENPGKRRAVEHGERPLGFHLVGRHAPTQPDDATILTLIGDQAHRLDTPQGEWPHLDRMTPLVRFWKLTTRASLPHHQPMLISESSSRDAHERIVLLLNVAPDEDGIVESSANKHPGIMIDVHLRLLRIDAGLAAEFESTAGRRFRTRDVVELWQNGHMQTEWIQRVKTLNGETAIVELGEEHLFPTHVEWDEEGETPLFSDLELQNSGWLLDVTPVFAEGRMDIKLRGEWTERLPDLEGDPLRARFSRREISSSFLTRPGRNLLIGHNTSPDRSQRWYWLLHTAQDPLGESSPKR